MIVLLGLFVLYGLSRIVIYPVFTKIFEPYPTRKLQTTLAVLLVQAVLISIILLAVLLQVNYLNLQFDAALYETGVTIVPIVFIISSIYFIGSYLKKTTTLTRIDRLLGALLFALMGVLMIAIIYIGLHGNRGSFSTYIQLVSIGFIPLAVQLLYYPLTRILQRLKWHRVIAALSTIVLTMLITLSVLYVDHIISNHVIHRSFLRMIVNDGGIIVIHMLLFYTSAHLVIRHIKQPFTPARIIILITSTLTLLLPAVYYYVM